jgi:hypothetical protein
VGPARAAHAGRLLVSITLHFSEALNPVSATAVRQYKLRGGVASRGRVVYTRNVGIRSVSYNAVNPSVTILLTRPYRGPVQATVEPGLEAASGAATTVPYMAIAI